MDIPYIVGQALGVVAVLLFTISYQAQSAKRLLLIQTTATAIMSLHYLLIGATSGLFLNIIGILRNLVYYHKEKRIFSHKVIPYILALIVAIIGAFSWQGYYSLFIIAGLAINTVCLSFPDVQKLRVSVLITCPLIFVYNVFVLSLGGMVNEAISFFSALVGIIRYCKRKKQR